MRVCVHVRALQYVFLPFIEIGANVEYVEVGIPADFPFQWRRFLPNVFYGLESHTVYVCVCVCVYEMKPSTNH